MPNDTPPPPTPLTKYSDTDVLPTAVAYWPLSEASATAGKPVASAIAKDAIGNNDGNYTHKDNAPLGMFPCPGYQIIAGLDSAQATGSLALGVVSLLPGDAVRLDAGRSGQEVRRFALTGEPGAAGKIFSVNAS